MKSVQLLVFLMTCFALFPIHSQATPTTTSTTATTTTTTSSQQQVSLTDRPSQIKTTDQTFQAKCKINNLSLPSTQQIQLSLEAMQSQDDSTQLSQPSQPSQQDQINRDNSQHADTQSTPTISPFSQQYTVLATQTQPLESVLTSSEHEVEFTVPLTWPPQRRFNSHTRFTLTCSIVNQAGQVVDEATDVKEVQIVNGQGELINDEPDSTDSENDSTKTAQPSQTTHDANNQASVVVSSINDVDFGDENWSVDEDSILGSNDALLEEEDSLSLNGLNIDESEYESELLDAEVNGLFADQYASLDRNRFESHQRTPFNINTKQNQNNYEPSQDKSTQTRKDKESNFNKSNQLDQLQQQLRQVLNHGAVSSTAGIVSSEDANKGEFLVGGVYGGSDKDGSLDITSPPFESFFLFFRFLVFENFRPAFSHHCSDRTDCPSNGQGFAYCANFNLTQSTDTGKGTCWYKSFIQRTKEEHENYINNFLKDSPVEARSSVEQMYNYDNNNNEKRPVNSNLHTDPKLGVAFAHGGASSDGPLDLSEQLKQLQLQHQQSSQTDVSNQQGDKEKLDVAALGQSSTAAAEFGRGSEFGAALQLGTLPPVEQAKLLHANASPSEQRVGVSALKRFVQVITNFFRVRATHADNEHTYTITHNNRNQQTQHMTTHKRDNQLQDAGAVDFTQHAFTRTRIGGPYRYTERIFYLSPPLDRRYTDFSINSLHTPAPFRLRSRKFFSPQANINSRQTQHEHYETDSEFNPNTNAHGSIDELRFDAAPEAEESRNFAAVNSISNQRASTVSGFTDDSQQPMHTPQQEHHSHINTVFSTSFFWGVFSGLCLIVFVFAVYRLCHYIKRQLQINKQLDNLTQTQQQDAEALV